MMVLALAAATTFAMAQAPETNNTAKARHGHGQHQQLTQDQFVSKRLAKMNEKLQLTQDQQAKVKDILSDQWTKQQALRSNTALSQQDARTQMRELRKSEHEQIMNVLTPEQRAKAKEMRKGEKGGRGMAARRMRFMARELNLTDAQKAQLKPMFQQQRAQMQALKADTSLTQDQKREKLQQLRADGRKQFLAVLTPEQQQKLRDLRSRHEQRKSGETPSQPGPGF
jgi:Spy/CpxP family protein refolding chaperone